MDNLVLSSGLEYFILIFFAEVILGFALVVFLGNYLMERKSIDRKIGLILTVIIFLSALALLGTSLGWILLPFPAVSAILLLIFPPKNIPNHD